MFAGGAERDHDPQAFHVLRGQRAQPGEVDFAQIGEAALSFFAAGRASAAGFDHGAAARTEGRDVGPRGGMVPHGRVHGGGDHDLAPEGESLAGEQFVGLPLRQSGDGGGGGGRDDQRLRDLSRFEMGEGRGRLRFVERGGVDRSRAESREGQRRDEFLGRGRQRGAHGKARVLPSADEVRRAIGGDGPAYAEVQAGSADVAKGEVCVHYWLSPCCRTPPDVPPEPLPGVR